MANPSIYAAFERMWQHVVAVVGNKSDIGHTHDDKYYTEEEIDNKGYLTEHQSLDGFATETYVDDAIATIPSPDLSSKQDKITGDAGDFVVIGDDGNVTTKTILQAGEVRF